jgi:hypothetical protein
MLRQWELDGIAAALEGTMPDLADIYRRTGNEDEYGGGPELVRVIESTKVGIAPADFFQFQQTGMAGRETDVTYYSLAFPVGTAIKTGDVIDIFTQGTRVTAIQIERAESFDTMVHVYGQEIDSDGWFELNLHAGGHS